MTFRVRTLDQYILAELSGPFTIALGVLIFVLLTREMTRVTELLLTKGMPMLGILEIILYLLPAFLILILPTATLIASTCAFSRLSSDQELIAMQASGIGLYRLLVPVCFFSIVVYGFTFALSWWAEPWSGVSLRNVTLNMLRDQLTLPLDRGMFTDLTDELTVYIPQETGQLAPTGIFIADSRSKDEQKVLVAKRWAVISDTHDGSIGLRLTDGSIHIKSSVPRDSHQIRYRTYDMQLHIDDDFDPPIRRRPDLDEIRRHLDASQWTDVKWLQQLERYYRNWAIPASCLIFGFIGVPLGMQSRRAGRLGGFAVGVTAIILYYLFNIMADFFVTARLVTPVVAAWFPDIVFGILCVALLYHSQGIIPKSVTA